MKKLVLILVLVLVFVASGFCNGLLLIDEKTTLAEVQGLIKAETDVNVKNKSDTKLLALAAGQNLNPEIVTNSAITYLNQNSRKNIIVFYESTIIDFWEAVKKIPEPPEPPEPPIKGKFEKTVDFDVKLQDYQNQLRAYQREIEDDSQSIVAVFRQPSVSFDYNADSEQVSIFIPESISGSHFEAKDLLNLTTTMLIKFNNVSDQKISFSLKPEIAKQYDDHLFLLLTCVAPDVPEINSSRERGRFSFATMNRSDYQTETMKMRLFEIHVIHSESKVVIYSQKF